MCLICVKKQGIELPKDEFLVNAERINRDGIGVAYVKAGKQEVVIKKDFKNVQSFIRWEKNNINKDDVMVVHFRLATHGLKDVGNRHPFPITKEVALLRKPNLVCQYAVAHNGIISQHSGHAKYSDTQKFVIQILSSPVVKANLVDPTIQKMVQDYIGGDRLAILCYDSSLILFGRFLEEEGLLFSNDGYKPIVVYSYNQQYMFDNFHESLVRHEQGRITMCDGCGEKKYCQYVEVEAEVGDKGYYVLCKSCRKAHKKDKLDLSKVKNGHNWERFSDDTAFANNLLQCDNCFDWFPRGELVQGDNGNFCRKCWAQYRDGVYAD